MQESLAVGVPGGLRLCGGWGTGGQGGGLRAPPTSCPWPLGMVPGQPGSDRTWERAEESAVHRSLPGALRIPAETPWGPNTPHGVGDPGSAHRPCHSREPLSSPMAPAQAFPGLGRVAGEVTQSRRLCKLPCTPVLPRTHGTGLALVGPSRALKPAEATAAEPRAPGGNRPSPAERSPAARGRPGPSLGPVRRRPVCGAPAAALGVHGRGGAGAPGEEEPERQVRSHRGARGGAAASPPPSARPAGPQLAGGAGAPEGVTLSLRRGLPTSGVCQVQCPGPLPCSPARARGAVSELFQGGPLPRWTLGGGGLPPAHLCSPSRRQVTWAGGQQEEERPRSGPGQCLR